MAGWETVVAALGGLLVGGGVGVIVGRRLERSMRRRLAVLENQFRTSVIPLLERRATEIGIPPERRLTSGSDSFEVTVELSDSIRRFEEAQELPFSDTIEVDRSELSKQKPGSKR